MYICELLKKAYKNAQKCFYLAFFYNKNIQFKLKDFKDFEDFRPIFVGLKNIPVSSSNRAFICIKDKEIFEFCVNRLRILAFKELIEPKKLYFEKFALINCDYKTLLDKLKESNSDESLF